VESGNVAWVLVSGALVLFMTPGLAFFYGGMVRSKNMLNMLMMNFWCLLVVPLLWAVVGYSLAFSGKGPVIGNFDRAFGRGLPIGTMEPAVMIFLATFAAITPALIAGAVADRMKFAAWAIFVPIWSLLVYVPVTYWVFSPNGWLLKRGSLDFAGGTAIHVNAGIAALAVILWFGWFGFNAGSALAADGRAVQAFINTFLASAAAGLAWSLVERARHGHVTNLGVASGVVAGLVAITPGCGYVTSMSSIAIGLVAGVVCQFALSLKVKFGFDDALDVIGVHLVGGLVGSLLIGLFADPKAFNLDFRAGLFNGGGLRLLGEQFLANGVTLAYSFVITFAIAKVLHRTIGLRVTADEESEGLDITQHSETAYHQTERSMGRLS
jgi:ammonium transporter, Amt family